MCIRDRDYAVLSYEEPYEALKAVTTQGHINAMYDQDGVLRPVSYTHLDVYKRQYETSIEVLTVLEEVIHGGTTMLMVTHNEQIAKMANRVIRMKGGVVAEIIVNRDVYKRQVYAQVFCFVKYQF